MLQHHTEGLHGVDKAHDKIPAYELNEEFIFFPIEPFHCFGNVGNACDAVPQPPGAEGLQKVCLVRLLGKECEGFGEGLAAGYHTVEIIPKAAQIRLLALASPPEG